MSIRIYIRTLLNYVFKSNILIRGFVNIYYKSAVDTTENIKFSDNLSKILMGEEKSISFQSVTGDKIDCK